MNPFCTFFHLRPIMSFGVIDACPISNFYWVRQYFSTAEMKNRNSDRTNTNALWRSKMNAAQYLRYNVLAVKYLFSLFSSENSMHESQNYEQRRESFTKSVVNLNFVRLCTKLFKYRFKRNKFYPFNQIYRIFVRNIFIPIEWEPKLSNILASISNRFSQ